MFSSGKAAREMYFRVMALEEPNLIVMNYAPGPVDTDMAIDLQTNSTDSEIRSMVKGLRDDNTILQPIQTAQKLISVIERGGYQSGDHIDYYEWWPQLHAWFRNDDTQLNVHDSAVDEHEQNSFFKWLWYLHKCPTLNNKMFHYYLS